MIKRINSEYQKKVNASQIIWDLEVEWKDCSTSWKPLKQIKETNTVDVAQYAFDNHIIEEPAFSRWTLHVLKKKRRIIKATQKRNTRKGFKFGIQIPNNIHKDMEHDSANKNDLWYKAIMKEMGNVRIAFQQTDKVPPGYSKVELMIIFDVKMDFTRKARLVARGDLTETPRTLTYSSVVSRESVRILSSLML
jgi:hypothetical protein